MLEEAGTDSPRLVDEARDDDVHGKLQELHKKQCDSFNALKKGEPVPADQTGRRDHILPGLHDIDISDSDVLRNLRAAVAEGPPPDALVARVGEVKAWVYETMWRYCNLPNSPVSHE
eukprot:gene8747-3621_t